jgi:hypothetical protein
VTSAAFLSALLVQLRARPALAAVNVELFRPQDIGQPALLLVAGRVRHELAPQAMARLRQDDVTIPALVSTYGSLEDAVAQAATIVGEVELELRDTPPQVGVQTLRAAVAAVGWLPLRSDKGGVIVDAEFDITYTASV